MRVGEIVTAGVLAALSLYMMWKSTELPIGYLPYEGPGGGAWPFWLSAIMLVCSIMIIIKTIRQAAPMSESFDPVLDTYGKLLLGQVFGGILVFVALSHVISMYAAMLLFLAYYLRFLGKHSWTLTASISIGTPVFFFIFFEALMRITLPKGWRFTDPFFNFLYTLIY